MKKKVIIACGGAIATSSFVADRVKRLCQAEGIEVNIVQCRLSVGMPLLSGIGEEETIKEILVILKD